MTLFNTSVLYLKGYFSKDSTRPQVFPELVFLRRLANWRQNAQWKRGTRIFLFLNFFKANNFKNRLKLNWLIVS